MRKNQYKNVKRFVLGSERSSTWLFVFPSVFLLNIVQKNWAVVQLFGASVLACDQSPVTRASGEACA